MAVKSVIQVDVDDAQFKRFSELFDKYQAQLAKTPSAWASVNKEQAGVSANFERMAAALMAQGQIARENSDEDKQRLNRLKTTEKLWTNIQKSSASLAKNVLDIGAGLLKWGSLITGGLIGGSLFGIDRLGSAVSNQRRSSLGLGLSIGEQKSFETNMGRFVDPNAFLGGINQAVSNVANQGPLYALGVNPNQGTADVAIATLNAVRSKALATPVNQLGLLESMYHLDQLGLGVEDIRRLRSSSPQEFNAQLSHFRTDVGGVGIGDQTGRAWQDFTTQMQRAGQTIFKTFVEGLVPLAGPLQHLSGAVVKFMETLSKSNLAKEAIDHISTWLENFSGTISKPEFLSKIEQFTSDIGGLADAVHTVADAVQHPGKALVNVVEADFVKSHQAMWNGVKSAVSGSWDWLATQSGLGRLGFRDRQYGLSAGMAEYVWGKESGNRLDVPDKPGQDATGPFQLKAAAGRGIDRHNFDQASDRAAQILAQELKHYKGDIVKAIAAYNLGDPTLDKIIGQYGSSWQKHVPYVQGITINNNTGGSAVVAASQLGP